MYHRRNCIRPTVVSTYIEKLWHIFANALVGMYVHKIILNIDIIHIC